MSETLLEFARFLRDVPEGDIDEALIDSIISQLSEIWDELKGGDRTSMDSLKVQRGHSFSWQPETCTLRFEIERHGSVVMG